MSGLGATVWLTGVPAAGKTTIGRALCEHLTASGAEARLLDGDELRRGPCADLGFDREARREQARRVADLAATLAGAGAVAVVSLVSPYATDRLAARLRHGAEGLPFLEVHVDTPAAECRRRDPKGLYAAAAAGELHGLTGVDDPYQRPELPELRLDGTAPVAASVAAIVELLTALAGSIAGVAA